MFMLIQHFANTDSGFLSFGSSEWLKVFFVHMDLMVLTQKVNHFNQDFLDVLSCLDSASDLNIEQINVL